MKGLFIAHKKIVSLQIKLNYTGGGKLIKTDLKAIAVGEPDIPNLTDGEKGTFFESLLSKMVEIDKIRRESMNANKQD